MNSNAFPSSWLHRLGLKIFSLNQRENLLPNLWCICPLDFNPVIIDITDQHVAFSINVNNVVMHISAIYASTSNLKRKDLWQRLSWLQNQYIAPRCFIGDFNTVLGAHEHFGYFALLNPL